MEYQMEYQKESQKENKLVNMMEPAKMSEKCWGPRWEIEWDTMMLVMEWEQLESAFMEVLADLGGWCTSARPVWVC